MHITAMAKEISSFAETMTGIINTFAELSAHSGEVTNALDSLQSQSEMIKSDYAEILTMTDKLHTAMVDLTMLSKKKVLVIDDEETILTMTKGMLKDEYYVTTVNSAKKALDLFLQGYIPHLVLLDLYMSEMDGWDAFIRIRNISQLHNTPIAIYTSSETPEDKEKAHEMGAVDYIHKPVSQEVLLEKVAKLAR